MFLNGAKLCQLHNREYTYVYLPPGDHAVMSRGPWNAGSVGAEDLKIRLHVEPGRTYFVQSRSEQEYWILFVKQYSFLTNVVASVALPQLEDCAYVRPQEHRLAAHTVPRNRPREVVPETSVGLQTP
jgi:hypothetical protein